MAVRSPIKVFAAITKTPDTLQHVASGGAFSELAKSVLRSGGVVFGAAWKSDFSGARHIMIEDIKDLHLLQGSKYTTSDMSGVYNLMRKVLESGRMTLFSGTPCQCAAIHKTFGCSHNLMLCSIICMANVNAALWSDYSERIQRRAKSRLMSVNLRYKMSGAKEPYASFQFENKKRNYLEPLRENSYWNSFFKNIKMCCYSCPFRSGLHGADVQIGDFWGVEKILPTVKESGVNAMLVYSNRALSVVRQSNLDLFAVSYDDVLKGNPYLEKNPTKPVAPRTLFSRILGRVLRMIKSLI